MKLTPHELARIRGSVENATKALEKIVGPNKLIVRGLVDDLRLCLSVVEQPNVNDEKFRMALFALWDSVKLHENGWYGLTNRENFNWSLTAIFRAAGYITEAANDP